MSTSSFTAAKQERSLRIGVPILGGGACYFGLDAIGEMLLKAQLISVDVYDFFGFIILICILAVGYKLWRTPGFREFGRHKEEWLGSYSDEYLRQIYQQSNVYALNGMLLICLTLFMIDTFGLFPAWFTIGVVVKILLGAACGICYVSLSRALADDDSDTEVSHG